MVGYSPRLGLRKLVFLDFDHRLFVIFFSAFHLQAIRYCGQGAISLKFATTCDQKTSHLCKLETFAFSFLHLSAMRFLWNSQSQFDFASFSADKRFQCKRFGFAQSCELIVDISYTKTSISCAWLRVRQRSFVRLNSTKE